MSKELADAIVLAAHKMEHNEVEVISLISYSPYDAKYYIDCTGTGQSFVGAYNNLAMLGYQAASQDIETRIKTSFNDAANAGQNNSLGRTVYIPVVMMVMSKKVNKK